MSSSSSSSVASSSSSDASSVASRSPSPPPVNEKKRKRAPEPAPAELDAPAEDEEPVLSHAAKRKQKKKELKGTTETSPSGKVKDEDGATAGKETSTDRPKRQNSVWVGNLSFKTTPEALKKFFDGAGEITRVHMPTKMVTGGPAGARKENRGFAYVDFSTPDAKVVAVTMSEQHLDGRKLLIKDGGDFTGRPAPTVKPEDAEASAGSAAQSKTVGLTKTAQKILRNQKQPPAPTLFFGNLGFDVTDASLRELLEAHSQKPKAKEEDAEEQKPEKWMRKIRLGTFEDSGKCKGWAFVDFTSIEHATAALTNPRNHRLNGRDLVVEFASPDAVRRGGGGPRPPRERDGAASYKGRQGGEHPPKKRQKVFDGDVPVESADAPTSDPAHSRERPAATHGRDRAGAGKDRGKRHRPAPGAALALAKREQVGIVPSQGTKIKFE
ncbi:unnamed protein product [Peniophora sp. CBMAI 1063]|nr:unnamed protein product [Peniophora sp. CBMAI 1063]